MTRYIELSEVLRGKASYHSANGVEITECEAVPVEYIKSLPVIATPTENVQVTAEWIKEETIMGTQYRCSNCDNADNKHTAIRGHYCWFCGAKMVRGGNDGKTNVQK